MLAESGRTSKEMQYREETQGVLTRLVLSIAISTFLLFLSGCGEKPAVTYVKGATREMAKAYEAKELDAFMSYYARSYYAVNDNGTPNDKTDDTLINYSALRAATERLFSKVEKIEVSLSPIETTIHMYPLGGSDIVATFHEKRKYTWKESGELKEKAEEKDMRLTFIKYAGTWKVGPDNTNVPYSDIGPLYGHPVPGM